MREGTDDPLLKHRGLENGNSSKSGRNRRSVWFAAVSQCNGAHFAVFPEKLVDNCIKAGCPEGGIVLDPFMGAGTTALVAQKLGRNYIGFELNTDYIKIAETRLQKELGLFHPNQATN